MKKYKLLFLGLPTLLASNLLVACNNTQDEARDYKTHKNINAVIDKFHLNFDEELQKMQFPSFAEFKQEFKKLDYKDANYDQKVSQLLSNNWMHFLAYTDKFRPVQYPDLKNEDNKKSRWFLFKENEKFEYSKLYKHGLGLVNISNETSIPHSHLSFKTVTSLFQNYSGVSNKPFESQEFDGEQTIYMTIGRFILKIAKNSSGNIEIKAHMIYMVSDTYNNQNNFINETSITNSNDADDFEALRIYFDKKDEDVTNAHVRAFEDKLSSRFGTPANVYLVLK
ncbi:hypothetical protein [Mycoplasma leonicaptivi]|uniref:hypothetical protein n=1 Tax=Mycoplasma leonicaptivi TaxID=36742 RepID=UPI000483D1AE|nr:hypothetical protein [Mycoplasma leonicaptivi]